MAFKPGFSRGGEGRSAETGLRGTPIAFSEDKVINHQGLTVFKPAHSQIRRLKRKHYVSLFGRRIWETCWLLIDYIRQQNLAENLKVFEVGCGWGLAGIYCAKFKRADVTCLDMDGEVFPYLRLHAEANLVQISTWHIGLESLTVEDLVGVDLLLGCEICFWDSLVPKLLDLLEKAREAGVRMVLIADPGRGPFEAFEDQCLKTYRTRSISWRIDKPYLWHGRILKICFPNRDRTQFESTAGRPGAEQTKN